MVCGAGVCNFSKPSTLARLLYSRAEINCMGATSTSLLVYSPCFRRVYYACREGYTISFAVVIGGLSAQAHMHTIYHI